jgi:hypothetical protein
MQATHLLLSAIVSLGGVAAARADLAPFTTDGCSSFPDGTLQHRNLWIDCCIRHDLAYWRGGTYQQRLDADLALEQCVAKVAQPELAKLMLQGVRAGGNPLLPTPFRWGYGWPFPRDYAALTNEELQQVKQRLAALQSMLRDAAP